MTPEQRLQEAKDQAIASDIWLKTCGLKYWSSLNAEEKAKLTDRVGLLMYEAGKKEGAQELEQLRKALSELAIADTNQIRDLQGKCIMYRKALEKTEIELLNLSTRLQSFSLSFRTGRLHQIIDIIQDALNSKP